MSDDNKTLVSDGHQRKREPELGSHKFDWEKTCTQIRQVTSLKNFVIKTDEYWEGWGVFQKENYFTRLYLDLENSKQISDAQVSNHYQQLHTFLEQLEDMERSGLYNERDYPGLHPADAKKAIETAFEQLKNSNGRYEYLKMLDNERFAAGKEKLMPLIFKAFEDLVIEVSEEEMLITLGKNNGLTESEVKGIIDEMMAKNRIWKRADLVPKVETSVQAASAVVQAVAPAKSLLKTGKGLAILLAVILVGAFIVYPLIKDAIADERIVIASNLRLRAEMSNSPGSVALATAPYGSKVIVYEIIGEWASVKFEKLKGYMSNKYLVEEKTFWQIDGIFADNSSRIVVNSSKQKIALLEYYKKNNFSGAIPDNVKSKFSDLANVSSPVWQIVGDNLRTVIPAVNFFGGSIAEFVVVIRNMQTNEKKLLIFSFDEAENAILRFDDAFVGNDDLTLLKKGKRSGFWRLGTDNLGNPRSGYLQHDSFCYTLNDGSGRRVLVTMENGNVQKYVQ